MKSLIVYLFSMVCISCLYPQTYWIPQTSPTTKKLFKCFFADSLYGWAVGDSGTIVSTTNSGNSWQLQQSGIFSPTLQDVYFIDRNFGWIVCYDSTFQTIVLHTTNGGAVWTQNNFPDTTMIFNALCFVNQTTGFITGYTGRIFKTTNNGAGWFECGYDTTGCFYLIAKEDIYFTNAQTGFACGGIIDFQGVVMKTTDGGANWNSFCLSPEPLNEIQYLGGSKVYVIGGDYDLGSMYVTSTNLGSNWMYDTTGCFGNARGFSFRTPAEVWAGLSFTQTFAVNLDSMKPGSRWQCIPSPGNTEIYDIEFKTPTKGWAVGSFGRIFKYNTDIIGINLNNSIPAVYELYQNYPNPFNPKTLIKYSVPKTSEVTITIYDALGRRMKTFSEGVRQAGTYSIELDASQMASGIYFYKMEAGYYTFSRKMAVIK